MDAKTCVAEVIALSGVKMVRWPKTWDNEEEGKKSKMKAAFELMMSSKDAEGKFDIELTVEKLIAKFGAIEEPGQKRKAEAEAADVKAEEDGADDEEDGGEDEDGKKKKKKPKKSKKTPEDKKLSNIYANEENRAFGDQILKEFTSFYFASSDPGEKRKGGVFAKAAKAFREAETPVTNKKEAMALPGVGKGIAAYLEEFKEKGFCEKLEKLRAGDT